MTLYYHPEDPKLTTTIDLQNLSKRIAYESHSLFYQCLMLNYLFWTLLVVSSCMGLLLRFLLQSLVSVFLLFSECFFTNPWGWLHQHITILLNRFKEHKTTTIKFMVFFILAFLGMQFLLTLGADFIIEKTLIFFLPIQSNYCKFPILKMLFFV